MRNLRVSLFFLCGFGNFYLCSPSLDGIGANSENPTFGSANQPLLWLQTPPKNPNLDDGGLDASLTLPNPRVISNAFSAVPIAQAKNSISDFHQHWAIIMHMELVQIGAKSNDAFHIPIPENDPIYPNNTFIKFFKSVRSNTASPKGAGYVQTLNTVTSFIDGSFMYGSNTAKNDEIREKKDGLLKTAINSHGEFPIPINNEKFSFGGPVPTAVSIVIVFIREHNRKARLLKALNPLWTDEQIFQKTRRWIIACIQKITFEQVQHIKNI
jgi:peroxidase